MGFSDFRANCRFFHDRIGVRRLVYLLRGTVKGAFLRLGAQSTLCFFVSALGILSIGNEGRVSALVGRVRRVLPTFLVPTAFRVNVYRFVRRCCLEICLSGNVRVRFFRLFSFVRCLAAEGGKRSFRRDVHANAPIYLCVTCLRVCSIIGWLIYFLGRAVEFACADGRTSMSFRLTAPQLFGRVGGVLCTFFPARFFYFFAYLVCTVWPMAVVAATANVRRWFVDSGIVSGWVVTLGWDQVPSIRLPCRNSG